MVVKYCKKKTFFYVLQSNLYTTAIVRPKYCGRCGEVAVVERVQLQYMYELFGNWDKISWSLGRDGRCGEMVVGGGSTAINVT